MRALRPAPLVLAAVVGCARFGAVYPPRPPGSPAGPVADPSPSRIVAHVGITSAALRDRLEGAVPRTGDGDFNLVGSLKHYSWERGPVDLRFADGKLVLGTHVVAKIDMRLGSLTLPIDLEITAQPAVTPDYKVKLQSTSVLVTSTDRRVKLADHVAGVFDTIGGQVGARLRDFAYDLRPTVEEAYARVASPTPLPIGGGASGCAVLKVLGVEAGPTVVADGLEKDLAIVVAPSVLLPCPDGGQPAPLPPLQNVAAVTPGPFTVTVPVAARYDELTRAMSAAAFTDGKYFFSAEYPDLYLEDPELYESEGLLVLKLHIKGPVHKFGIDTDLDGDLFLTGHLSVVDNELSMPDLEPTIETRNFLLSLKAMTDGGKIRDQARAAMRLDIGERLRSVREKLSSGITFGGADACFQGDVDKIEVTGAYAHGTYARVYVAVTAHASASVPCTGSVKGPAAEAP